MAKFYQDIYDCPVDSYHKCLEENKLKYLVKKGSYRDTMVKELSEIFEKISDQKIDIFGVSDKFEMYIHKLRDVNKMRIKVLKGDRSAITFMNTYESDLTRIENSIKGGDSDDDQRKYHARLHRLIQTTYQGRNSHELTVFEFYNDINDIKESQEQNRIRHYREEKDRKAV